MADQPSMRRYGRHLFICTHGDCAPPEAGEALAAQVRTMLGDRRRLQNPERIKCSTADCLGVCSGGPVVVVYPDGIWYDHVDAVLLKRIVDEHLHAGTPVEEAVFHRLYPPGQEPDYAPYLRGDAGSYTQGTGDGGQGTQGQGGMEREKKTEDGNTSPLLSSPCVRGSAISTTTPERQVRRIQVRKAGKRKGLLIVNTGYGKGKTSAALGLMTRAWGRGMRICVLQFLKHENSNFGETRAAIKMGIEMVPMGDGFTWTSKDLDESAARAVFGWQKAQEKISSGAYDLVILDEFTYPMRYGWIDPIDVVNWLRDHKPENVHVVITGRNAPLELIEAADTVTEMRMIKHHFENQGIKAQPGIEF